VINSRSDLPLVEDYLLNLMGANGHGISVNSYNGIIRNNRVSGSDSYGIYLVGQENRAFNNTVAGSAISGLYVGGTRNNVTNNSIRDNYEGLLMVASTDKNNNQIKNNLIENSTYNGVRYVHAPGHSLSNNTIKGSNTNLALSQEKYVYLTSNSPVRYNGTDSYITIFYFSMGITSCR